MILVVVGPFSLLLATLAFVGASVLARRSLPKAQWGRRLRALTKTQIADAKPGVVKIVGKVRRLQPLLRAPLSDSECVGFEVEVYGAGDKESTLIHDRSCHDFLVEDGTGVALVRGQDATLMLRLGPKLALGGVAADSRVGRYLEGRSVDPVMWGHWVTGRERLLEEGEAIVVCGHGRYAPDPDPRKVDDYRELPTRFVILAEPGSPLLVSNDPTLVKVGQGAR